ncbi:MAG TPA: tRNA (adenosine(37)-N6)-threonylcarbamoyltransferase complex dimerization subunit type 1 TsaB [Pseudomonadales bacterium]|nr:tRNA (adenosine(37)-N6)-threonylcarbamoyltransferase complex dimerization subunit type 1 TsaB [Pseudomonadales bacterium]
MSKSVNILAIDTAGAYCSVGLLVGGTSFVRSENTSQRHSRHILGMIDQLLIEAGVQLGDLHLLAWNAGPGSFTGLRIGASVIQALAYSFSLPVLPLSSLEVIAYAALREACPVLNESTAIAVAMDARMNGVYWARFISEQDVLRRLEPDQLLDKDLLDERRKQCSDVCLMVGDAWPLAVVPTGFESIIVDVSAADVMALAMKKSNESWLNNPAECLPYYVHNTINWQKRRERELIL